MKYRLTPPKQILFPLLALSPAFWIAEQIGASIRPPIVGLLLLFAMDALFRPVNKADDPHVQTLEKQASAQFNDPGFAAMTAQNATKGGTYMPTRGIQSSDSQKGVAARWLIVVLTLLITIVLSLDHLDLPGPMDLSPYTWVAVYAAALFFMERVVFRKK